MCRGRRDRLSARCVRANGNSEERYNAISVLLPRFCKKRSGEGCPPGTPRKTAFSRCNDKQWLDEKELVIILARLLAVAPTAFFDSYLGWRFNPEQISWDDLNGGGQVSESLEDISSPFLGKPQLPPELLCLGNRKVHESQYGYRRRNPKPKRPSWTSILYLISAFVARCLGHQISSRTRCGASAISPFGQTPANLIVTT